ncbi:dihydroorotase [Helicobacter sp. MIT 99-10781]|uniref:dihydroorotase n=1 Tax=Helicobacter sp. MIT 99-10781 TaxID=1332285 RepID=UPI000E203886|nr:dihydroorotase [Helicobacter sp. MIT 99-10781]RDU52287.1 dihydroorotase [Helicobacter sp. MIT 99-10781]
MKSVAKYFEDFAISDEFRTLDLKNPLDMHLHLREGAMLESILPFSARDFLSSVVMPNLSTPITTTKQALAYKEQILALARKNGITAYEPLMTLYLTNALTKKELREAKAQGIKILKLYPKGATTNSQNGVSEVLDSHILEILQDAQELDFILSIHGESAGFCLEREFEFLEVFATLARTFPRLKIIIEHMSDSRSIPTLEKYENLYATLSLHHILLSLDDVLGGGLYADLVCKPMLKRPQDSEALLNLALNAHKKVSFGSDSAPHLRSKKYAPNAPSGIFSAPSLLPVLASVFAYHKRLENLQAFVSDNAVRNYDLSAFLQGVLQKENLSAKIVRLESSGYEIPQSVPCENDSINILFGGQKSRYKVL